MFKKINNFFQAPSQFNCVLLQGRNTGQLFKVPSFASVSFFSLVCITMTPRLHDSALAMLPTYLKFADNIFSFVLRNEIKELSDFILNSM